MKRPRTAAGVLSASASAATVAGALLATATLVGLLANASLARQPGEEPLEDILQVLVLDREVVAIDARGGADTRLPLRLGEVVERHWSRGQVGLVVTDRRFLAVGASSGAWQEADRRQGEQLRGEPQIGDRVALVVTTLRVLGFDGGSGNLVESRLGLREQELGRVVDANVAVVVTDRRALGLSPFRGGFFEAPIQLDERVETVEAAANLATVRTSRRLLTFRAPSGSWSERRLGLGN